MPLDVARVATLFSGSTAGWVLVVMFAITLVKMWPAIKAKVIEAKAGDAAIHDGQYKRVVDWCEKLESRIEVLEHDVETCHDERDTARQERDEARAEALRWKAVAEGVGQNRMEEAANLAALRLAEDQKNKRES